MSSPRRIRLFLDSNVLTEPEELSLHEVEENLLLHAERLPSLDATDQLIEDYRRLMKLINPELVPYPDKDLVRANRRLIRHDADVPVLLSGMASKPDWLLTHKTKHFTKVVAQRCASQRRQSSSESSFSMVREALQRMEAGRYGRCVRCEKHTGNTEHRCDHAWH
ncbi:MAG TPA: hypothetical protein VFI95_10330 [Terriglobales bacterium]|nr:hypothetical protein [Terriglobales bacterium]